LGHAKIIISSSALLVMMVSVADLRKLVNGEALAASLLDAGTRSGSEAKGGNAELGDFEETARHN
jgi:hypothetical protein